jgi:hypothetical protein
LQAREKPKSEERAKNENLLDSRLGPNQDAQQQARSAIASGGQSVERQMTFLVQFWMEFVMLALAWTVWPR